MERQISVSIYAGAFVISLAIFMVGIYIGMLIDSSNLAQLSDDVSSISGRMASLQVLLLGGDNESFCPIYTSELGEMDKEIEDIGYKLTFLEDERNVYDAELKKEYFLLEAQSYLLSEKAQELCGDESVLLINFYSNKNCPRCREQGTEVLKARDELASEGVPVKLFSFDGELDSPVAEAFEVQFGVSGYPTIVIDGKSYSGFRSSDELQTLIRDAQ
ncbi:MAG: hypothetical protein AB1295_01680 [Candidatus Micrarchaeota archaeon]